MAYTTSAVCLRLVFALAVLGCKFMEVSTDERPHMLEFYLHDIVTPTNFTKPTAKFVIGPTTVKSSVSFFGATAVIDDKITLDKDFHSEELGRARGYYICDSLDGLPTSLLFAFTAVFTKIYNGSTLSFFGQDQLMDRQRIISVIGGTKHFEFARGTAIFETVKLDGFNVVLHFKVKIAYPQYV